MSNATAQPFVRRAELSNSRWLGPHLFSFLAEASDTLGLFSLLEVRGVAGGEPGPHTQANEDESFYVLEGVVEFQLDDASVVANPGDFVYLPAGREHSFRFLTPEARFLILISPGPLAAAFREVSEPALTMATRPHGGTFDPAQFVATFARYGVAFRGPTPDAPALPRRDDLAVRPAPGRSRWYLGHLTTPLVGARETGGRFAASEAVLRRGQEPPWHVHSREDESFYVLEGAATFYVDDQHFAAEAGTFVYLPRHRVHTFTILSDTLRVLFLLTPPGLEDYFEAFSRPAPSLTLPPPPEPGKAYDPAELVRAGERYGFTFARRDAPTDK